MGKNEKTEKKQKHFWKDFKAELKKVIWPTKKQVFNNTAVVLIIVLIVSAIVFVLDLVFEALNTYGIDKLKTFVQSSVVSEEKDSDNNEDNNNTDDNNSQENQENTDGNEENAEQENNNEIFVIYNF